QLITSPPQLVTGLDARAGPAITHEQARRATLQQPDLAGAVVALHVEEDVAVWARVAELGDRPDNLDRMLLIEHRKRVVPPCGTTRCEPCTCRKERGCS